MSNYTILFMGPTGAGKDTQAQLIVNKFGACLIRTGDLVRAQMPQNEAVVNQLKSGDLVDDKLVNDLVGSFIDQCKPETMIVSDGFPRRLTQAEWFDEFLAESGRKIDLVLVLQVDETIILERLTKRQRHDDNETTIKHRLALYTKETEPVIEYYTKRHLTVEIDGSGSVEDVHARILAQLHKVMT